MGGAYSARITACRSTLSVVSSKYKTTDDGQGTMNFDFKEKEIAIREKLAGLFDSNSRADLERLEGEETQQTRDHILQWLMKLGQTGYLALGLESARDSVSLLATQETLATISPSLFLSVELTARLFGRLVASFGTHEQKDKILPNLKEGCLIGAVALSERGMSIGNAPMETSALSVDGGFRLKGAKAHVVNAPVADWIAVAGNWEEDIVFFLIRKEADGLSIGKRLSTLGYNGTAISPIFLENCFVQSNALIGPFKEENLPRTLRMWEDQILTAASLGLMHRAFDTARAYAKDHKSGGKPIIAYQEVGFKLAEILTLLHTAQLLAYRAAWMVETGDREAGVLVHCAKVFCSESAEEVTSSALQILGGKGYVKGNPAEEGYRNAKYLRIAGTSSEISRMKIADEVLRNE
jgi:alkylation response protein AidB-like acyl-CoA dehydrogenase